MQQVRLHGTDRDKLIKHVLVHIGAPHPQPWYNPTFEQMKRDREEGRVLVFGGGAAISNTIFFNPDRPLSRLPMYAYRAWHDTLHLKYGLPFEEDAELELAKIQQAEAERVLGFSEFGAYLLWLDLELHIKHYWKYKQHPNQQRNMIEAALIHGVDRALDKNWS